MRPLFLAAGLAAALSAGAASAEPFTLLIYETPADIALRSDTGPAGQAYWADYADYAQVLQSSGAIRGGAALTVPADAIPSSGLHLGGYFSLDVADQAAAESLARQAPSARRGGRAEVRAAYPAPTMMK